MNKRILELAEQARWMMGHEVEGFNTRLEMFADSIIQECAKIGEIKEQGFGDYDPNISVGWYMRKHFGIEK